MGRKKLQVALVFGGKSGEHEVSLASARSIYQALDKSKYEVLLTGIDKGGNWHMLGQEWLLSAGITRQLLPEQKSGKVIPVAENGRTVLMAKENQLTECPVDVFFPIVHGTYGEDGCLQGLFELLDVPYVGAGVLGSAVGMDKDVQKRLLVQAGIQVAKYRVVRRIQELNGNTFKLKYPVFVKPANLGSSVGISKVNKKTELEKAVKTAFQFDTKVLIEEYVHGREIECSVLGNASLGVKPEVSMPGEVIPKGHEFYDYEAKYLDEHGAVLRIPAAVTGRQLAKIRETARRVFEVLECDGMARVDMFLKPDGSVVVNEINTLPGFTSISMYPKLWEASGLSYQRLLDRLIALAMEKRKRRLGLQRSYSAD